MTDKILSNEMRAYARKKHWPTTHAFYTLAAALDKAVESGGARTLLGAWARARKAWCAETGESLV